MQFGGTSEDRFGSAGLTGGRLALKAMVVGLLTLLLLVMCLGRKGQGRINRLEGGLLLACFVAYTGWLLASQFI